VALDVTRHARLLVVVIVVLVFGGLGIFLWLRGRQLKRAAAIQQPVSQATVSPVVSPSPAAVVETPTPEQTPTASVTVTPLRAETPPAQADQSAVNSVPFSGGSFVGTIKLVIPVVGVRPDQLLDTFADARSEGRVHDAIDIPAAAGTAVIAAADGEVIKLFQSDRGGTTIYQLSVDRKLVFYYAHLQRYADGIVAGKFVKQGEVIAYVGDTGNAGAGNFHLHFSIAVVADPKRYWEGTNINPYPLLRQ
jgi:murein DD-endopeptidase MepM/ murein hydrolase activator NlpD